MFNVAREFHYTSLYKSFFINYHFRSFFGSIILGGVFLIIFSYVLFKNLKEIIFSNPRENILIYIVLSSYFLTLSYTLLRASIMSPKYVLFILPLIIVWIGIKIDTINIKNDSKKIQIFLVSLSFVFFLFNINNSPIDRPPTKKVLDELIKHDVRYIVTTESDVFNNYLKTKTMVVKNKITILKKDDVIPKNIKKFWLICLNNARFEVGDIGLLANKPKPKERCLSYVPLDKNFIERLPIINNTQDYLIRKFINNDN
jgi:hypothetical protein